MDEDEFSDLRNHTNVRELWWMDVSTRKLQDVSTKSQFATGKN